MMKRINSYRVKVYGRLPGATTEAIYVEALSGEEAVSMAVERYAAEHNQDVVEVTACEPLRCWARVKKAEPEDIRSADK